MTFYGVWKGFIKQALSIVGIIVGYIVATAYYAQLSSYFKMGDPNLAKIISFIVLFLGCIIIFTVLALVINRIFKLPVLGMINSFLGGVIGFLKGFILVAISVIALMALLSAENPLLKKSVTVPYVLRLLVAAENAIPKDIKLQYQKKMESLMKNFTTEPNQKKK
jgi:membrane protein required for colicin V production